MPQKHHFQFDIHCASPDQPDRHEVIRCSVYASNERIAREKALQTHENAQYLTPKGPVRAVVQVLEGQ